MKTFKLITKIIFGVLFIAAGVNHFVDPEFYLSIMPPYLPWHNGLVIISGIAEIVLGVGLLIPQVSRYAAWGFDRLTDRRISGESSNGKSSRALPDDPAPRDLASAAAAGPADPVGLLVRAGRFGLIA